MKSRQVPILLYWRVENVQFWINSIGHLGWLSCISNFPRFHKNVNSLELWKYISENSSPKGSFWRNKKKSEFSELSWDSPYLLAVALKEGPRKWNFWWMPYFDICDTGSVLYQLSYQAIWELVILWVRNIPVDGDHYKWMHERPYTQLGLESPVQTWFFFQSLISQLLKLCVQLRWSIIS